MDVVVGILAAWGLIMLCWTLYGLMLLPLRRRDDTKVYVVLRGVHNSRYMERYLRGLLWLRNMGMIWWDILIPTDGLSMDTLERLDLMMYKESHIIMAGFDQLKEWMEDTYEYSHKRTDSDPGDCGSGPL